MGMTAALKARTVVENSRSGLAIELLVAAQALDWRVGMTIDPIAPRAQMTLAEPEEQARRFESAADYRRIAEGIAPALRPFYQRVREASPPTVRDRPLSDDVRRVRQAFTAAARTKP